MLTLFMGLALVQVDPSAVWGTCLGNVVGRLAAGRESPDAIADQAMRACRREERRVREHLARQGAGSDVVVRAMRERMRELAITTRAQIRGSAAPAARGNRSARRGRGGPDRREAHAFDLVNHYGSPVTRFEANVGNGWSRNWITRRVAPYGRQNLRFNQPTGCRVDVRVTFADRSMVQDQVNFCGATYLNVSGEGLWSE